MYNRCGESMKLWLSKTSDVPVRDQLATQIAMAILSGDYQAGQRLPSTRELALRLHIHQNTVSAVYRDLARRGWVEFRKGSGIYARAHSPAEPDQEHALDFLIRSFFESARQKGYSLARVQSSMKRWLEMQPPDHFLVVDREPELRRILAAEIEEATGVTVKTASPDECAGPSMLTGAALLVLDNNRAESVMTSLPPGTQLIMLRSRSLPVSLQGKGPVPPDALVIVVSVWPDFLEWSRRVLVAAGVEPDALSLRDGRKRGWHKGIALNALVIADTLTAREIPAGRDVRVFRIIADSSIDELRRFIDSLPVPPSSVDRVTV
ncbi:MAG: hypothetical protein DMF61_01185 [Blastocatellia bacterium AA13]|nr:MAG: hypothetical protein DMF61_01185 [Blastocatellia bacterium AA13]